MFNSNLKKSFLVVFSLFSIFSGFIVSTLYVQPVAAADASSCESSFVGLPAWYRGLEMNSDCTPKSPSSTSGDAEVRKFIWHIVANVTDMGVHIIAYITIAFILYGGFTFITSNGSSDKVAKGKNMILNAVVGLIICIVASAVIGFVIGAF